MQVRMDLSHLFSTNTKILKLNQLISDPHEFDISEFDEELKDANTTVEDCYKSNDEDIEDLYDLLSLINMSLDKIIVNKKYSDDQLQLMMDLRRKTKKLCNKKYRDAKDDNRKFWNAEEYAWQHSGGSQYIWKPSVTKIIQSIYDNRDKLRIEKKETEFPDFSEQ
jgi:hypothetical protein